MNRIPHSLAREEFETLLGRFLWNDLDRYGKKRLFLLAAADPGFAREFRELTGTDEYLRQLLPENRNAAENDPAADHSAVGGPDTADGRAAPNETKKGILVRLPRKPAWYAAAALLAVGFTALVLAYRGGYLNQREGVAFSGSCTNVPGKGGETRLVNSSRDAFCDASTRSGSVLLRIFPGSDASILPNDGAPVVFLDKGAALVRGEKRPPGSEIRIFSGANSVRFLGTEVFVRRSDAAVQVEVVSGAVEVGRSNANLIARELAALPDPEREALISSDKEFFENTETEVLAPGETRTIHEDRNRIKEAEAVVDRLKAGEKLTPSAYREWRSRLNPGEEAALELDRFKSVPGQLNPERAAVLQNTWKAEALPLPSVESEKPGPEEPPKDEKKGQNRNPEVIHRPTTVPNPRQIRPDPVRKDSEHPHNVFLANGKVIAGRARQDGEFIVVLTDGKEVRIPRSDVLRIESR